MILVSACLLGSNCKYNGRNNEVTTLLDLLQGQDIRLVCPEVAGGLPIPRPPAEIIDGDGFDVLAQKARVMNIKGEDVTENFLKGCQEMLKGINLDEIDFAILKEKSPSCGVRKIYTGEFNGTLKPGTGVGAAFLKKKGITVFSEEDLEKIKDRLN